LIILKSTKRKIKVGDQCDRAGSSPALGTKKKKKKKFGFSQNFCIFA
jgi:hypothetical protein